MDQLALKDTNTGLVETKWSETDLESTRVFHIWDQSDPILDHFRHACLEDGIGCRLLEQLDRSDISKSG